MGILSWIVFGLIAGAIAKLLHRGDDPGGWIVTIIIGVIGAFVGGAIIVLAIYRLATGRKKTSL